MTYYGSKELADSFRTVRNNTIKIAEEIPEAHYGYKATPETRSVAETLVHIAVGTRLQEQVHLVDHLGTLAGFDFASFMNMLAAEEQTPRSKAQIVDLLHTECEKFAQPVAGLTENFLAERVQMPAGMAPTSKSRFEMLMSPKEHEMHHRGQLMLVERMLGITPHLTRQMQERMASMRGAGAAN